MSETPSESVVFKVGDQHLDAWGNEVEVDEDGSKDYTSMSAKALVAELQSRNEKREPDDQITIDGKATKTKVIAALEADDDASDDDEDEDNGSDDEQE